MGTHDLDDRLAALELYRLAAIVASSDDAIISKDLDGTIRSWNAAAERIFGYRAEEIVGDSIFRLIPEELHAEEHELLGRIRRGERVNHCETTRVRKDGRRVRISLTLSPVHDRDGRLIGASAIKRDVTAERALEAQLQQARRVEAIGRLTGGIAHDFNNLLTVIGGMTAMVLKRLPRGSAEHSDLEQVAFAAARAAALTQQLLMFGRRDLDPVEDLDLNDVVRRLEPMVRRLMGEQIELRIRLSPEAGLVRANHGQLEQVLVNLVANARDAMADGGTLTVETQDLEVAGSFVHEQLRLDPGRYTMLAVSDTGQGMDAVTQASIFEPFFTTKELGRGTGLGLATVQSIIQRFGGAVYVYSELGSGAVFKVYLPRVGDPAPTPAGPAEPPAVVPRRGHATILVAEDEAPVRTITSRVLEDAGYRVLSAADGEAALALAAGHRGSIDLLLTDLVMPGINGRVLGERLRAERPDTSVLYMSGYTDDVVVRTGVVASGAGFLQKPFTPEALLARVREALDASPRLAR